MLMDIQLVQYIHLKSLNCAAETPQVMMKIFSPADNEPEWIAFTIKGMMAVKNRHGHICASYLSIRPTEHRPLALVKLMVHSLTCSKNVTCLLCVTLLGTEGTTLNKFRPVPVFLELTVCC